MNAGLRTAVLCLVMVGFQGCRSGSVPTPETGGPAAGGDCALFPADNVAGDTLTIACNRPVDTLGPLAPANEATRLLDRQIYETLVRVDCRGRLLPGLARSWQSLEGGRIWEFRLRKGARFSNGDHLTGRDVVRSWTAVRDKRPGPRRPPWTWVRPESVRTEGDDRLWVALPAPLGDRPWLFANPELAVIRPPAGKGPALGSGSFAWDPAASKPVHAVPNRYHPEPGLCVLRVLARPGADPRDLLSGDADLVIVSNRDALEYAKSLPGVRIAPLPWSRLYLLLSTRFGCASGPSPQVEGTLSLLRDELAGKVVDADARPVASFSFDPDRKTSCFPSESDATGGRASGSGAQPRILYRDDDGDAGRIASRLVALEAARDDSAASVPCLEATGAPVAAPETWAGLVTSVVPAADWAYVISVRRDYPDPCLDLAGLRAWIPWAGDQAHVLPLLVSRDHLVVKTGLKRIDVDWDGIPVLTRTGWDRSGTVP